MITFSVFSGREKQLNSIFFTLSFLIKKILKGKIDKKIQQRYLASGIKNSKKIKLSKIILFSEYDCLPTCMHMHYVYSARKCQKKALGPMEIYRWL